MTADLRKLAEAARRVDDVDGLDRWRYGGEFAPTSDGAGGRPVEEWLVAEESAAFIAACSPAAIIALLDRAEKAERERDEERLLATMRGAMLTTAERERDEARAERDARPEISHAEAAAFLAWCEAFDKSVLMSRETRDANYALAELRAHAQKAGE